MTYRPPRREGGGPRRSALVTGASAGIGLAFAERLAREHYDLVLVARRGDHLEEIAKRLRDERGVAVEVLAADLTHSDALRLVEQRVAEDATLDLLVNNAGFGTQGRFAELEIDREEEEIRLNVIAVVRLTRAALPHMLERGRGEIVNVSSMAGFYPGPYLATYGATKAFVTSFTEAIAGEIAGSGVRVQALCPGFTRTEFQARASIDPSRVPAFAWMSAEDVVDASLAALAAGEIVVVPGGLNKAMHVGTSLLPRAVVRRVMAAAAKRFES